jgi:sugar (pentulose or hexulose) kinase
MDHSTATTFHLQDQVARKYHAPFLERLGITESQLSALTNSGTVVGPVTADGAEATGLTTDTRIVTGCFDHPAAARAVGVTAPGQLMLSCGTSWVGFFPEPDRRKIIDAELLCDPFLSETGVPRRSEAKTGSFGAMFSVPAIGGTIDSYVREVIAPGESNPYDVFSQSAAEAPAGADGLTIDLQSPAQKIDADRRLVSRAVMESAARLLDDKLRELRRHGFRFERAVMVGGPAESRTWPAIVAEITGLEVERGSRSAGAQGAAMLAREAC